VQPLAVCNSKEVQPHGEAPVSLLQMEPKAVVPTEKLSPWFFAVRWARLSLEQQTALQREQGWNTVYSDMCIEQLTSLEAFLNVSWDAYMESLHQTPMEVLSDV
jgi:hypothetical protein